jgi:hypothetical protein
MTGRPPAIRIVGQTLWIEGTAPVAREAFATRLDGSATTLRARCGLSSDPGYEALTALRRA